MTVVMLELFEWAPARVLIGYLFMHAHNRTVEVVLKKTLISLPALLMGWELFLKGIYLVKRRHKCY